MDSSFMQILTQYGLDYQRFEAFDITSIYVLKKKIEEKKNDAQKNILLDALCISNTVYKRLIQYVPDINNLKEENINPESFASSKKYYDTDTDSYYSECVDDGDEIDIKQLLSPDGKLWILVKPGQSGKTTEMINDMRKNIKKDEQALNILICDNSLIQTEQARIRIRDGENLITVNNCKPCEISSNKNSHFKHNCDFIQNHHEYNVVIMCSKKLHQLYDSFISKEELNHRPIYIYIDEADKIAKEKHVVNMIKNNIMIKNNVQEITYTTATPVLNYKTDLCTLYGDLNLFPLSENIDKYNNLQKMNRFNYKSYKTDTNCTYTKRYLKYRPIIPGEKWIIPSEFKMKSHDEMKKMLFENDLADIVIVINSNNKNIYYKNELDGRISFEPLSKYADGNSEMKAIMINFVQSLEHTKYRIVITGNNCISRGVSFQSIKCDKYDRKIAEFIFNGMIFGPKISKSNSGKYQAACRMASNIETEISQLLVIDEDIFKSIILQENLAFDMMKKSFASINKYEVETITQDYFSDFMMLQDYTDLIVCGRKLCEYDDINDIDFYDDKEKAIEEIRRHCEGYIPKSQEMDENGFYVTTNEAIPGKQRMVVSWEEMKNIKNIRYGMKNVCDEVSKRLRPCYLDVNDNTTLRWITVVRLADCN